MAKCFNPQSAAEKALQLSMIETFSKYIPSADAVAMTNSILTDNNGHAVSYNPDGVVSETFKELLTVIPRNEVFIERSLMYTDRFKSRVGDWTGGKSTEPTIQEITPTVKVDNTGDSVLLYHNGSLSDVDLSQSYKKENLDSYFKCLGFAKKGLQSKIEKGFSWKIEKDFLNSPLHIDGGLDIIVSSKGTTIVNGGSVFKAAQGVQVSNGAAPQRGAVNYDATLLALSDAANNGIAWDDQTVFGIDPPEMDRQVLLTRASNKLNLDSDSLIGSLVDSINNKRNPTPNKPLGGELVPINEMQHPELYIARQARMAEYYPDPKQRSAQDALSEAYERDKPHGYINGDSANGYLLTTMADGRKVVYQSDYGNLQSRDLDPSRAHGCSGPQNVGANACGRYSRYELGYHIGKSLGIDPEKVDIGAALGYNEDAWFMENKIMNRGGTKINSPKEARPGDFFFVSNPTSNYLKQSKSTKISNGEKLVGNGFTHVVMVDRVDNDGVWVIHKWGKRVIREKVPILADGSWGSFKYIKKDAKMEYGVRPDYSKLINAPVVKKNSPYYKK